MLTSETSLKEFVKNVEAISGHAYDSGGGIVVCDGCLLYDGVLYDYIGDLEWCDFDIYPHIRNDHSDEFDFYDRDANDIIYRFGADEDGLSSLLLCKRFLKDLQHVVLDPNEEINYTLKYTLEPWIDGAIDNI